MEGSTASVKNFQGSSFGRLPYFVDPYKRYHRHNLQIGLKICIACVMFQAQIKT